MTRGCVNHIAGWSTNVLVDAIVINVYTQHPPTTTALYAARFQGLVAANANIERLFSRVHTHVCYMLCVST